MDEETRRLLERQRGNGAQLAYDQAAFEEWLRAKGKSVSTVNKYARQAHKRILKDLGIDFYAIDSMAGLQQLVLDVRQLEKRMENDPRRMYSAAVGNYVRFRAEPAVRADIIEESRYEMSVEQTLQQLTSASDYAKKSAGPQPPAKLSKTDHGRYQRDEKVGATALILANYTCRINPQHRFFISRTTHQNYVEAHHLIPIAYQGLFEYGIDVVENVVSLCPCCHRLVHYGEDQARLPVIEQLYAQSSRQLATVGLQVTKKELLEMY